MTELPPTSSTSSTSRVPRLLVVGIDPGGTAGLVCLSVLRDAPSWREGWRWVDSAVAKHTSRKGLSDTENRLASFDYAMSWIRALGGVAFVVIERPNNNAPRDWSAKGQSKGRGQTAGTMFAIGEAYGMLAAAAHAAGSRVTSYPATSAKEKPGKRLARVGWMPMVYTGRLYHVQARGDTLEQLHRLSIFLRARPLSGVVAAGMDRPLDDNILMALGVLTFHLNRQPNLREGRE